MSVLTLRESYLATALISTARAQRDPSDAHRALATRRKRALDALGGMGAASAADVERAMKAATAAIALDELTGCTCGYCPARRAA